MKVLIVLINDSLGGAEQYLKMIADYHKNDDVSVYFMKNNSNGSYWNDSDATYKLSFLSGIHQYFGMLKFSLKALLKRDKFDYVFSSHILINAFIGILLSMHILKSKYFIARESTSIYLRYTGIRLAYYKLLYHLGYRKINLLIAQTETMKSQLLEHFPALSRRTKVKVIPNPFNYDFAIKMGNQSVDFNLPSQYIVSAGRLINVKGFDILINAFSKLKSDSNLKLLILGTGPEKNNLENLTRSLSVQNDVIFTGHVDNVYPYFKHARLCVVSSRIEGFPNVLLQMMSQNYNIVSTLCAGGINEIEGVFTSPTNDVEQLEIAIQSCIANDNSHNRSKFDSFLKKRSVQNFMKSIYVSLETL